MNTQFLLNNNIDSLYKKIRQRIIQQIQVDIDKKQKFRDVINKLLVKISKKDISNIDTLNSLALDSICPFLVSKIQNNKSSVPFMKNNLISSRVHPQSVSIDSLISRNNNNNNYNNINSLEIKGIGDVNSIEQLNDLNGFNNNNNNNNNFNNYEHGSENIIVRNENEYKPTIDDQFNFNKHEKIDPFKNINNQFKGNDNQQNDNQQTEIEHFKGNDKIEHFEGNDNQQTEIEHFKGNDNQQTEIEHFKGKDKIEHFEGNDNGNLLGVMTTLLTEMKNQNKLAETNISHLEKINSNQMKHLELLESQNKVNSSFLKHMSSSYTINTFEKINIDLCRFGNDEYEKSGYFVDNSTVEFNKIKIQLNNGTPNLKNKVEFYLEDFFIHKFGILNGTTHIKLEQLHNIVIEFHGINGIKPCYTNNTKILSFPSVIIPNDSFGFTDI